MISHLTSSSEDKTVFPDYRICLHHHAAASSSHSFFFVVVIFSLSSLKFPKLEMTEKVEE